MTIYFKRSLAIFLFFISIVLTKDISDFYNKIISIDGAGSSLYLFQGWLEVNDRIPLNDLRNYFISLVLLVIFIWIVSIIMLIKYFRKIA